jgi:hypothetical protein
MTISAVETLIVFVSIFGIIGAVRGPSREIWTVGGVTVTLVFLFFGGAAIFEQLPVRLLSGAMALVGNQGSSNSVAAHPVQAPWTYIWLWVATAGLIVLSYLMGNRFGGADHPKTPGAYVSGFAMGMMSGLFIAVFLFNDSGLTAAIDIQFPDGLLTRTSIVPLILIGLVIVLVAIITRQSAGNSAPPAGGSKPSNSSP